MFRSPSSTLIGGKSLASFLTKSSASSDLSNDRDQKKRSPSLKLY